MLNWSWELWKLSAPDIVILCHALFHDTTFGLGAIIAKRLSLNRTKGLIFGGIFASRLAKHLRIPIRHYEKEEKLLPPIFLDYKSMVAYDFLCYDKEKRLIYNPIFDEDNFQIVTLPAPALFHLTVGKYLVPLTAIHAYRNPAPAEEPEPEPQFDPSRQSSYQCDPKMIANQWQSEPSSSSSQYDPNNYYYGYQPGQPWP